MPQLQLASLANTKWRFKKIKMWLWEMLFPRLNLAASKQRKNVGPLCMFASNHRWFGFMFLKITNGLHEQHQCSSSRVVVTWFIGISTPIVLCIWLDTYRVWRRENRTVILLYFDAFHVQRNASTWVPFKCDHYIKSFFETPIKTFVFGCFWMLWHVQ